MKTKFLFVVLTLLIVFSFNFEQTFACTCMPSSFINQAYDNADAVFVGTVSKISEAAYDESKPDSIKIEKVHFKVDEAFKGVNGKESFTFGTALCDFNFSINESYLVYADYDHKKKRFVVHLCSRSAPLKYAQEDLDYIRKLKRKTD